MKMRSLIGWGLALALCPVVAFGATAAAPVPAAATHRLDIRPDPGAPWEADLENVQKVLESAAGALWVYFPNRELAPILVEPKGGPIVLFNRGKNGEFRVRLNTGERYWAQYAFQFAHEFCHILCNPVDDDTSNKWFEESLCEMASLFALRRMAETWKTDPPYPNWREYAPSLRKYADERIEKALPPAGRDLAAWYREHEAALRREPCRRELNEVVAVALLPLFEKEPPHWQAVGFLNAAPVPAPRSFATYLSDWHGRVPAAHQPFVRQIAARFGITLQATSGTPSIKRDGRLTTFFRQADPSQVDAGLALVRRVVADPQ